MNLNKYTKAELISKLHKESKKIQDSKINIKSYFNQLWELILTFKSLLLKLTLISLIIKIFKRFSILSKVWRILSSIVMTIFGLNLIDNFAIDFFSNFFKEIKYISHNIIFYITQTQFYIYLTEIFKGASNEKTVEEATREQTNISRKNTTDESRIKESESRIKESNRNSKVAEWLKPTEAEINDESMDENSYYDSWKVYLITGTIIVAGCFIWVYSDEIKSTWTSFYEWAISFRSGPGDNSGNPNPNTGQDTRSNIQDRLKEALKKDFATSHKELANNLDNDTIPNQGKLALGVFILCLILLISYLNTITYFLILINLDNKTVQNWINRREFIKKLVNIYRQTRIAFLIFEICLSLFIILFILYNSYRIYVFYLIT